MEIYLVLFGESNMGRDGALVVIGGGIVAAIGKAIEMLWNSVVQGRADKKEEQGRVESHLEKRVARLETDNSRCDKRVKRLNRRQRELEHSNMQLRIYINNHKNPNSPEYVEVPLPPDPPEEEEPPTPAPGTDVHLPLPPGTTGGK